MTFIDVPGGLLAIEANAHGSAAPVGHAAWGISKRFAAGVGGADNGTVFSFELC